MVRATIPESDELRRRLLEHGPAMAWLVESASEHRLQVAVTVVDRRRGEVLERHGFRVDAEYFYPASTIKLAGAMAALVEMERMKGIGLDTQMVVHPLRAGEAFASADGDARVDGGVGAISLGREIRKLFLVSDNVAFNRLYEFVGHARLNALMRAWGLSSFVCNHRLSDGRVLKEPRATARVDFLTARGKVVVPARGAVGEMRAFEAVGRFVGRGIVRDGVVVEGPVDFGLKNRCSLADLQRLVMLAREPGVVGVSAVMGRESSRFMRRAMAELPGDSVDPVYSRAEFPDSYGKFLLPGLRRVREGGWVMWNKVGQAYGFTIENAWVEHPASSRAFVVSAVIETNANGILNDDRYEYEEVAFPFMADLGEVVGRWMLE